MPESLLEVAFKDVNCLKEGVFLERLGYLLNRGSNLGFDCTIECRLGGIWTIDTPHDI